MGGVVSSIFGGGGGGGGSAPAPAPSSQTVSNTSIPEYARPYVENMLGQTAALTDINQNPYQTYGGARIADFSPLQQQAFANVANQTIAPQIGTATNLSGESGQGYLRTVGDAGMYGQQGAGYGNQAAGLAPRAQQYGQTAADIGLGGLGYGAAGFGAGQQAGRSGENYARMATDPSQMQAYMNPYVQASLQPQLNLLQQQGGIQGAAQQAAATQAGAFGGSRSALANALSRQNSLMAQQQAIGQGYNQAFQNAQQAQQFGANLGLQGRQAEMQGAQIGLAGLGTAMQGQQTGLTGLQQAGSLLGQGMAGAQIGLQGVGAQQAGYAGANQAAATLGQLGQTQFGQQQAINQAQQTTGAVQQAQAQQALDTAYQDFLKQKNYPYQQLAFMADMTRGLPLSQAAQTQYTAPPSAASQLGGLGMSALGIYGMSGGFKGSAEGGLMAAKRYKEGGYADGGQPMAGEDVIKQLTAMLDNPELNPLEVEAIQKKIMMYQRMLGNPQAQEIMSPAEGRTGIASIGTGEMVPEEIPAGAGGGIVAFASGGKPQEITSYQDMLRQSVQKKLQGLEDNTVDPFAESKATEADIRNQLAEIRQRSPFEALANAGLATMAGTSQYGLSNLGLGGIQGLKSYSQSKGEADQLNKLLLQQGVEREKSKYARDMGTLNAQLAELGRMDTKEIGLKQVGATAAATAESRAERLRLQAAALWKDTTHDIATELKDQAKFNSVYRKDPSAFNALVEQEAKKRMDPKTLELIGKTPYKAPAANPAVAVPGAAPKTYPPATPAAINALKSSKDLNVAKTQFDAIFGPGAADKALGK